MERRDLATFKDPDWGTWAICKNDKAFSDPRSEVYNTPMEKKRSG